MLIALRTMGKAMSLTTLYSILLHLVHTVYTCTELISDVCSHFAQRFCDSRKATGVDRVSGAAKRLDKIPRHVIVVLGTETPSYRDLASIAVWCVAAGVPYISFYEHSGLLKRTKHELYTAVVEASLQSAAWNRSVTGNLVPAANRKKNGVAAAPAVHINVLSLADGRGLMATLAKECATGNVPGCAITADYLDGQLKQRFNNTPDPDMALCCGSMFGTYGVLPWQVRNTEFVNIRTHHGVRVGTFLKALHTYGYCEQRFGK